MLERDEAYQLLTSRSVPADRDEKAHAGLLAADLGYHAAQGDLAGARKLQEEALNIFRRVLGPSSATRCSKHC